MCEARPKDLQSAQLPMSRTQAEAAEPTKKSAASYSSHHNSDLQDVLLADSKSSAAAVVPCISSELTIFSNSSHNANKKTRDLPNVSDCHGCGRHVNVTNHKDRLQTLDSFWRIVLLCRNCIRCVVSAELCSYCFSPSEDEADCFLCCGCKRRVHKECVTKYRYSPPWSYCHSNLDFRVCIDCWIPKFLIRSNSLYEKKGVEKKQTLKLGVSKVPANLRNQKSLKDAAKDAKSNMNDKISVAEKAKDNKLRKALIAKRAVEFANDALELVAAKNLDSGIGNHSGLVSQLQRVLDSSPGITDNVCSLNSTFLSLNRDNCSLTTLDDMKQESKVYVRRHKKFKMEEPQQDPSRSQGLLARLENGRVLPDEMCNEEKPDHNMITYTKRLGKDVRVNNVLNLYESRKQTEPVLDSFSDNSRSQIQSGGCEESPTVLSKERFKHGFSYTKRSANGITSKDKSLGKQVELVQEPFLDKPGSVSHVKSNGNEECDDRYAVKYTKRFAGCKKSINFEAKIPFEYSASESNDPSAKTTS